MKGGHLEWRLSSSHAARSYFFIFLHKFVVSVKLKARFCWGIFNNQSVWCEAKVTLRRWQLGRPASPLWHSPAPVTCEVRDGLPPTGEGSALQRRCPSQFSALFILQPSWKTTESLDFLQSENWLSLFLKVLVELSCGKFIPVKKQVVCVSMCACVCAEDVLIKSKSKPWMISGARRPAYS